MAIPGSWTLYYDWGCDGSYGSTSMTINANGTWTSGEGYSGLWVQSAGMFIYKFNTGNTTYAGNVASKSITGIQSTFAGSNGCFYMLEAGAGAAVAAKAEVHKKGKLDSSGKA